jgi:C_GCAxxG_C_C family probable redox protein
MSEQRFIERIGRRALSYDKYSGCSQSVLLSLQEGFKIGNEESFKAATVLSGGIARRGETCGAIIGALMSLGLVMGRDRMEDTDQYVRAVGVASEICEKFKRALKVEFRFDEEVQSTLCKEIQEKIYGRSFDLNNEAEMNAFLEAGGHSDRGCPKVCAVAAKVAAKEILDRTQAYNKLIEDNVT